MREHISLEELLIKHETRTFNCNCSAAFCHYPYETTSPRSNDNEVRILKSIQFALTHYQQVFAASTRASRITNNRRH